MPADTRIDAFLRAVAKALHAGGAPAQDLERHIGDLGAKLGVNANCFALPTMLSLTVVKDDGGQRVQLLRVPPSDYNMVRLIELEKLVATFPGPDAIEDAMAEVERIATARPPWTTPMVIFCGGLLSATAAVLFKGGVVEMVCGGIVGTLFVVSYLLLSRWRRLGPVLPVILCALAAVEAQALSQYFTHQEVFITVLSGIVLMLPGFTTTVALSELATQNLLAGSGRLAGAFILMVMMGAGVAIGTSLGNSLLPAVATGTGTILPAGAVWLSVAGLGISFMGVLQAPFRSAPVVVGACLMSWSVMSAVSAHYNDIAGAFCAAFAVGFAGHLYQLVSKRPAMLFQVPGLLTLVPGSVGFRGLNALIEQDFLKGIKITTDMVLTATALAVGILLANGLSPFLPNPRMRRVPERRVPGIR